MRKGLGWRWINWVSGFCTLILGTLAGAQEKPEYKPTVFGFMQLEYRLDDSGNLLVDNTFAARRVWFGAQGSVNPLINYNFLGAFGSTTFFLNAFVDLRFDPMATVRAGQWQINFTYEGWQPSNTLPFITRSNVIQHIAANYGTEGGPVLRDIGLALRGAWKSNTPGGYEVGLFNGNGGNKTDNNGDKDLIGRAWITPIRGLLLGVSGLRGKEGPFGTSASKRDIIIWGLDLGFEYGALRGRAEYVAAKYKGTLGVAEERPQGFYFWTGYKVLPSLEPLARYDALNVNSEVQGQKIDNLTLGVTYTFKKGTHLMLNYLIRDADDTLNLTDLRNSEMVPAALGLTAGPGLSARDIGNAFLAQLQVSL